MSPAIYSSAQRWHSLKRVALLFLCVGFSLGLPRGVGLGHVVAHAQTCTEVSQKNEQELARQLFRRSAQTHEKLKTFKARYTQTRTSLLLADPLRSCGHLVYRRAPGCVVLEAQEAPKEGSSSPAKVLARIRLDERYYQVFRPQEKRLERFSLEQFDWPRSLFSTFSQDLPKLEKSFRIRSCKKSRATAASKEAESTGVSYVVLLEALDAKAQKQIRRLELTIRDSDAFVTSIAYDDPGGDQVRIELEEIELNAELPSGAFDFDIPPETRVIEHAPKKK